MLYLLINIMKIKKIDLFMTPVRKNNLDFVNSYKNNI